MAADTVTIRDATPGEIGVIAAAMAGIDPWLTLRITAAEQEAAIRRDPLRRILAAEHRGGLAGACTFRTGRAAEVLLRLKAEALLCAHDGVVAGSPPDAHPPAGYIHTLAVFPGFQGCGAGAKLLEAAERAAAAGGAREMLLFVSDFNPRARAFYERNGYRFLGAVPDCIRPGLGEHLMVKNL
jgi:ribosomal protein S18 acetylase RimI-like enzyme